MNKERRLNSNRFKPIQEVREEKPQAGRKEKPRQAPQEDFFVSADNIESVPKTRKKLVDRFGNVITTD